MEEGSRVPRRAVHQLARHPPHGINFSEGIARFQTVNSESSTPSSKEQLMASPDLPWKQILVPVDFSEFSEKALKYASNVAAHFGASVTLIHVIQPVVYPADFGYPPTVVDTLDE